jgi:hypothetical protein
VVLDFHPRCLCPRDEGENLIAEALALSDLDQQRREPLE